MQAGGVDKFEITFAEGGVAWGGVVLCGGGGEEGDEEGDEEGEGDGQSREEESVGHGLGVNVAVSRNGVLTACRFEGGEEESVGRKEEGDGVGISFIGALGMKEAYPLEIRIE